MLEQFLKLDVAAEYAHDLVVLIGHSLRDREDERTRILRLIHVGHVQFAVTHGLLEPAAVGIVVSRVGQVAVLGGVGLVRDYGLHQTARGVGELDELDIGIVVGKVLHGFAGLHLAVSAVAGLRHTRHDARSEAAGHLLELFQLGHEEFRHMMLDQHHHFLVGERGIAALFVRLHDVAVDEAHGRMLLRDLALFGQVEIAVDPVGHTRTARLVGDDDGHRAVEDARGVEDVVDLFVLGKAVHMNARAGSVEIAAHKGIVRRNDVFQLALEIVGYLGDDRGVGGIVVAREGDILHDQGFHGRVAGAFAKAEERTVDLYVVSAPANAETVTLDFGEELRIAYAYDANGNYLSSCGEYGDGTTGQTTASTTDLTAYVRVQTPYDANWQSDFLYAVAFEVEEVEVLSVDNVEFEDGTMGTVASIEINGVSGALVDIDGDGIADYVAIDVNGDGDLSEDEVFCCDGQSISMPTALISDCFIGGVDDDLPDYMNDNDTSAFA